MTKDFADFLGALNNEGAAYVVIGGMAVIFHIPYRTTRDIDVLIEPTLENARNVRRAVERLYGARRLGNAQARSVMSLPSPRWQPGTSLGISGGVVAVAAE
jgi:hypothetical protein